MEKKNMYSSLIGITQLRNWIRNLALTQNFQMSSHAMSKCLNVWGCMHTQAIYKIISQKSPLHHRISFSDEKQILSKNANSHSLTWHVTNS